MEPITTPAGVSRRTVLANALATAGLLGTAADAPLAAPRLEVENVTRLYPVEVARIAVPRSTAEVVAAVTTWPGQVAVTAWAGRWRFAAACTSTCASSTA